uniref:Zinc finger protein 614 n=1 Tax=Cacopsylla melanoneura TaxID=428564 RepID=A0A8D8WM98_9HEMI
MAYNPQSRPQPVFNINPNPNQVRDARPQPVFNLNPNQSREPRPQPLYNVNPNQSREPRPQPQPLHSLNQAQNREPRPQPQPLLSLNANHNRGEVNQNHAREPPRSQPLLNLNQTQNREPPRSQPLLNLNTNHARPQPVFNIDPSQLQNVFNQAHFNPNQAQYDPRQLGNFNMNQMNFSNTNHVNSSASHGVFNTNQAHASSYQAHSQANVPNQANFTPVGHANKTMSANSVGNYSTGNNKPPVSNNSGGFSSGNLKMNLNEPLSSVIYNYLAPDDQQRIILNQSLQHFKQDPSADHVERIINTIVRNDACNEPVPAKKKAKQRPEKWEQNMTRVINDVARAGHFYVSNPNPQIACKANTEDTEGAAEGNAADVELPQRKGGCFMCSKCAKPFSETQLLMEHVRECTVVGYTCGTCGKNFKFKNSMVTHRKTFHEGVRYKCTKCPKIFMAQSKLNIHMKNHEGVFYTCEHCPKTFCSKYSLKEHSRRHDGKKYVCSEEGCDKEFYVERYFRDHLKTHEGNRERFNCEKCEKSFSLEKNLKTHIRNKHGPRKQTKNLKIYAATMKEILENPDKAKEILEARRRKLKRKPAKKRTAKKKVKKTGVKGKKDGVKGKKDGVRGKKDGVKGKKDGVKAKKGSKSNKPAKPRKKKKDLGAVATEGENQNETAVKQEGDVKPEEMLKKKKRRAKPKNRSKYYYVMGKDGMLIRKMKKQVKKVQREIFRCHCGHLFFDEHPYKLHLESHASERYFCAHCNKLYHVRYYLIEHLKTHDAAYNFYCFSCRKYFKSEEGHRKWHDRKSFSCKLCPKSYTSRVFLLQHVKQLHGFENYPTKPSRTKFKAEQNGKSAEPELTLTESKETALMGDHFLATPNESVPESSNTDATTSLVNIKMEPTTEPSNSRNDPNCKQSLDASSPEPKGAESRCIKMEPSSGLLIGTESRSTNKNMETEDSFTDNTEMETEDSFTERTETETSNSNIQSNTLTDRNMDTIPGLSGSQLTEHRTDSNTTDSMQVSRDPYRSECTSNHRNMETATTRNMESTSAGYTHTETSRHMEASGNFGADSNIVPHQRNNENTIEHSETSNRNDTAGFTPATMETSSRNDTAGFTPVTMETSNRNDTAGFTPATMEPPPDNIGPDFSYMNYLNLMCKTPDVGNFHNT